MEKKQCLRCQYSWIQRTENVKACPNCKSRYWNLAQPPRIGRPIGSRNEKTIPTPDKNQKSESGPLVISQSVFDDLDEFHQAAAIVLQRKGKVLINGTINNPDGTKERMMKISRDIPVSLH